MTATCFLLRTENRTVRIADRGPWRALFVPARSARPLEKGASAPVRAHSARESRA